MKNGQRLICGLLNIAFLTMSSCGNPHLTEKISALSKTNEDIIKENALTKDLLVVNDNNGESKLSFGQLPSNVEVTRILTIFNKSTFDLPLNIIFQSGSAYSFSGGKYPGSNGNCTEKLKANENCKIEILFQNDRPGVFEDFLVLSTLDDININIPLSGERLPLPSEGNSKLVIANNVLGTTLNFGKVAIGSTLLKEIEINNTSEKDLIIKDIALSDEAAIHIVDLGTCTKTVKPGSCKINLSFKPTEVRSYLSDLTIKDGEDNKLVLKILGAGIVQPTCTNTNEIIQKPNIQISVPLANITLPYQLRSPKTSAHLDLKYGTDYNIHIKGVSIRTIENAQVLVEYKIPAGNFSHLSDMTINLDVWKIINDRFKDTEILCLSSKSFKRCSGRVYTLDSWKPLLNPKFWNNGGVVANTLFEDKLGSTEKKCGEKNCEVLREEISLKDLFNLSASDLQKLANDKTFHIILADDSRFLSLPMIKIKTEETVNCSLNN